MAVGLCVSEMLLQINRQMENRIQEINWQWVLW